MTVRNAVAKRDEAAVEAARKPTLAQVAEQAIGRHAQMLDAILPASADRRRFAQMTIQACRQAPDLAACFATKEGAASFLLAVGQAAMVNLEPNTPTQECWILPRKNKGRQEAQLMIGYRGLLKLARRSGSIQTIYAEVVHERDHFRWARGLAEDVLEHTPFEGGDRGEMTHAYAVARFREGGYQFTVLSRVDVEARRAKSDSWSNPKARPHSPWTNQPAAMWRKSAIRALIPFLDLSPEAEAVVHRDERPLAWDGDAIEVPESYGELAAVADESTDEPPPDGVDGDTGEIDQQGDGDAVDVEVVYPPGHEPFTDDAAPAAR